MFTILTQAFRRTAQNWQIVLLLFLVNFCLGLFMVFPSFSILKTESLNSLAFNNLLTDFDFTVFADFLRNSGKSLRPLLSISLILAFVYIFSNIFFSGGILSQFTIRGTFRLGDFFKNSTHYFGKFFLLSLVQLSIYLITFGIIIIVFGVFGAIGFGDTETKFFAWMVPPIIFATFCITYLLNTSEYAKVLLYRDKLLNPWQAFWKSANYVFRNFKTMQIYWSVIFLSFVLLLLYFWLESSIGMTSGFTIVLMFLIQQMFIFSRVFIRIWNLSNAFDYLSLRPIPLTIKLPIIAEIVDTIEERLNDELNTEEGKQENKLSE
ncbi:hypothetical protein [Emticicia sp. SJ17W-69]|uniref:hypothetical protein n=1 Tax=Emticicia sp. SJ17W-69 TaxID=3421657 RepID=UPI003EB90E3B